MSIPSVINHTGVLVARSSAGHQFPGTAFDSSFAAAYGAHKSSQLDVTSATDEAPAVLPLENVVKVRVIALQVTGNTVKCVLTSASGTNQAIPASSGGIILIHCPGLADPFTAVKFVGNGATGSYLIAGDLS